MREGVNRFKPFKDLNKSTLESTVQQDSPLSPRRKPPYIDNRNTDMFFNLKTHRKKFHIEQLVHDGSAEKQMFSKTGISFNDTSLFLNPNSPARTTNFTFAQSIEKQTPLHEQAYFEEKCSPFTENARCLHAVHRQKHIFSKIEPGKPLKSRDTKGPRGRKRLREHL